MISSIAIDISRNIFTNFYSNRFIKKKNTSDVTRFLTPPLVFQQNDWKVLKIPEQIGLEGTLKLSFELTFKESCNFVSFDYISANL